MHLARKCRLSEMVVWTRWEIVWLVAWSTAATALLVFTRWNLLSIPAALFAIVGTAVAVVLAFKNQQSLNGTLSHAVPLDAGADLKPIEARDSILF